MYNDAIGTFQSNATAGTAPRISQPFSRGSDNAWHSSPGVRRANELITILLLYNIPNSVKWELGVTAEEWYGAVRINSLNELKAIPS